VRIGGRDWLPQSLCNVALARFSFPRQTAVTRIDERPPGVPSGLLRTDAARSFTVAGFQVEEAEDF
jgi:hypothetical protein